MSKPKSDAAMTALRLPAAMAKRIDKWGKKHGAMSRSDAIRRLLERALDLDERAAPMPEWVDKLEKLAARLNTDAAGAVAVLDEYLSEPDQPAEAVKPPRKGLGSTLRSWVF